MGYWDTVDQHLNIYGYGPTCHCGKTMFLQDDHGRFTCSCSLGVTGMQFGPPQIPQVDVSSMSNEQKAKVALVNRLESEPTTAEAKFFSLLRRGPDVMGTPEYIAACKALDEERAR